LVRFIEVYNLDTGTVDLCGHEMRGFPGFPLPG
jgi:hypothetical protein